MLTKYRKKNDGTKAPMYYTENSHPAIISKEMFELARKEMAHRAAAKDATTGSSRYTSKYPFSGLLVCGACGSRLRRHVRTMGAGNKVAAWGCATRVTQGREACSASHHVRENVLQRTYKAAIRQIVESADDVTAAVREGAMLTMEPENQERLNTVEQAIIEIQESVLDLHKKKVARKITDAEYENAVKECRERMKDLEAQQAELKDIATRYSEVKAWTPSRKPSRTAISWMPMTPAS